MAGERRDNSGAAWKNDRKRTDRDPGYTGSATIGGEDFYVSVWVNDDNRKAGQKKLSFSFTPKNNAPTRQNSRTDDLNDDDIPFD